MTKYPVFFHVEDTSYNIENQLLINKWIANVIKQEDFLPVCLNIILCSDKYLLKLNQKYLKHNTYTDVITFDNSDNTNEIEGDIFISIDRIKDNAIKYNINLHTELIRIIIHGVLHLLGYTDKTSISKNIMKRKEDDYLALILNE